MASIFKRFTLLRNIHLISLTVLLATAVVSINALAQSPGIEVLTVKGPITPPLADFIKRGIDSAEKANDVAVIIQLDTPGGLDTSMRDIIQTMVSSTVPIVVYVGPSGARAASAGTFITLAAHVTAMAPSTSIGAAHPVTSTGGDITGTEADKILNDSVSYIRGIAAAHGRNADWAESAVRQSVSVNEQDALKLNIIDMVAPDLNSLINQLDGRQVALLGGNTVTLHTKDVMVTAFPMTFGENFLYTISDPNIAYLLLGLAIIGIIAEIAHPGFILPGVIGAIALLLGLYSLGTLPVNWVGVILILLAFALFIAEIFTATFGILAASGLLSLIVGSIILFRGSTVFQLNPWLIVLTVVIVGGFIAFVINRVVAIHSRQPNSGAEELVGMTATVKETLNPEGSVMLMGELWNAISESGPIEKDQEVVVTRVDGLKVQGKKRK